MDFLGRDDHLPEPPVPGLLPGAEAILDHDLSGRGVEAEPPCTLALRALAGEVAAVGPPPARRAACHVLHLHEAPLVVRRGASPTQPIRRASQRDAATPAPSTSQDGVESAPSLRRILEADPARTEAHAELVVGHAVTSPWRRARSAYRPGARGGIRYPTPRRGARRPERARCFILRSTFVPRSRSRTSRFPRCDGTDLPPGLRALPRAAPLPALSPRVVQLPKTPLVRAHDRSARLDGGARFGRFGATLTLRAHAMREQRAVAGRKLLFPPAVKARPLPAVGDVTKRTRLRSGSGSPTAPLR